MQDQKTAALATTFSDVLTNLAFMFTDEETADLPAGEIWLETMIAYDGPVKGYLRLRCTRDFSIRLAANLLGLDPDDPDIHLSANDAVKEFMNIICGQYVTAAHGTEAVFSLTIPELVELSETPELAVCEGLESCVVSVDDQCVQLSHLPERDQ